jgi:hypothetical protein
MLIDGAQLAPAAPLDEAALNATGKIDRAGLKRLAEAQLRPHGLEAAPIA